jgi:hypothetical protein
MFYQTKGMSNAMFLDNFQTLISVVEDYGGKLGIDPSGATMELVAAGIDVDNASAESKRDGMAKAKNKYLSMVMLTA